MKPGRDRRPSAVPGSQAAPLVAAAWRLRSQIHRLPFGTPVSHVYNPLTYAWDAHEEYLRLYGKAPKSIVFLGMNPGPFGMVQTGVPFGEVDAVRNWLKISARIGRPISEHPKRPVLGFSCHRSEVSGRRLWGLFAARFGTAQAFFQHHFVLNYCPLAFLEETGRNRTPDKLPTAERKALFAACDEHLLAAIDALRPEWLIGIGDFAFNKAQEATLGRSIKLGRVLHPSPASPAANRDWAGVATRQLEALGVWHSPR